MAKVIHVDKMPEPENFDQKVRQSGLRWMKEQNIDPNAPLTAGTKLEDYWRHCKEDIYSLYKGCCAYLGVKLNRIQNFTIDHYKPKSKYPVLAYEWDNYRLCSPKINSIKGNKEDILDPFKIETGWFYYNFLDGSVFANPLMPDTIKLQVENTIELLKLNDDIFCEHRCACWDNHKNHPDKLYNEAPFIYFEAKRQHIL